MKPEHAAISPRQHGDCPIAAPNVISLVNQHRVQFLRRPHPPARRQKNHRPPPSGGQRHHDILRFVHGVFKSLDPPAVTGQLAREPVAIRHSPRECRDPERVEPAEQPLQGNSRTGAGAAAKVTGAAIVKFTGRIAGRITRTGIAGSVTIPIPIASMPAVTSVHTA
jgi:hypothetical protein